MSHITPEGPKIPQIPAVQGRRKFIEISSEYQVPIKCIHSSSHLESFQKSEAYLRILDFLQTLNESIQYKKLSDPCHESDVVHRILSLLNTLDGYITEFPPEESGQRFGNVSFRKWCLKLESVVLINQESLSLHQLLLNDHPAIKELIPYLQGAFGDKTRIDYGSGHELSFIGWLCCLELLNVFDPNDTQALVTRIFARYLELVRKLQRVYNLEPAGSHGVWGLDDYQFLPYFWVLFV
jgi:serine/threonine-protein phosphatase 2A activator